jgi:D-sedoheptulose 7-phosphate isomerase
MQSEIIDQLHAHITVMSAIERDLVPKISSAVDLLARAFEEGKKLLVMGNGGSAADAQHFAGEIVGRFKLERRAIPAIALTTDSSVLTAIGNDYGFDLIFRRQVEAFAQEGDVVIGISTSGNSKNVYEALLLADEIGCTTIGLLGRDGGAIKEIVDLELTVPSGDTPRVQEGHIAIIHIICDLVERRLFGKLA